MDGSVKSVVMSSTAIPVSIVRSRLLEDYLPHVEENLIRRFYKNFPEIFFRCNTLRRGPHRHPHMPGGGGCLLLDATIIRIS